MSVPILAPSSNPLPIKLAVSPNTRLPVIKVFWKALSIFYSFNFDLRFFSERYDPSYWLFYYISY
jgi:hypothetical protein